MPVTLHDFNQQKALLQSADNLYTAVAHTDELIARVNEQWYVKSPITRQKWLAKAPHPDSSLLLPGYHTFTILTDQQLTKIVADLLTT